MGLLLLFFIGPAADARYIFPSNVLCSLLIATGWLMILDRAGGLPWRRTGGRQ